MPGQTSRSRYAEPTMPPPSMPPPPPPPLGPPPQGPPPVEPPPPIPSSSLSRSSSSSTSAHPSDVGQRPPTISSSHASRQPPPPAFGQSSSRRSRSGSIAQSASPHVNGASHASTSGEAQIGLSESTRSFISSSSTASHPPPTLSRQHSTPRTPSRTLLQQALSLAQQAVLLDQESEFGQALEVYKTTVGLLEQVMVRVEAGERRRRERGQSTVGGAEEEGRTLRGIYDAYTSRIALLSEQLDDETPLSSPALSSPQSISHPYQSYPFSSNPTSSNAQRSSYTQSQTQAHEGIGSAMLSSSSSATSIASASHPSTQPPLTANPVSYHRPRPSSQLSSHSRTHSLSNASPSLAADVNQRPQANSRGVGPPPPPPAGPPPTAPPPIHPLSSIATSNRSSLLPATVEEGAEADLRRQSLLDSLDSLELSLGPKGGNRKASGGAGLGLEGVSEAGEGTTGAEGGGGSSRFNAEMEVLDKTPLHQVEFDRREVDSAAHRGPGGVSVLETSEGTISQRRKAANVAGGGLPDLQISGGSSIRSSSVDLDRGGVRTAPPFEASVSSSSSSTTTPSPTPGGSDSQNSLPYVNPKEKEKSNMFRLRALSQPGRRPSLSPSLSSADSSSVPPVPQTIQRKSSIPHLASRTGSTSPGKTLAPFGIGRSSSATAGGSLRSTSARSAASSREAFEHYPPVPPSPSPSLTSYNAAKPSGAGAISSTRFASSFHSSRLEDIPSNVHHRSFYLMRVLRSTMVSPSGAYVTKRLHVSPETWSQSGVHLANLDAKLDALASLTDALANMERAGKEFEQTAKPLVVGMEWMRVLEAGERAVDDVQFTLGKKLGMEFGGTVKIKSGNSFMGLGKKLTTAAQKKLNSGRNANNVYVEDLGRLFGQAQFLDDHLKNFTNPTQPPSAAYLALPTASRSTIEQRLKRLAEFFGQVVVVVVLRDLGLLMDKHAKQAERWLSAD